MHQMAPAMCKPLLLPWLLTLVLACHLSVADVGTAGQYNPPYLPTDCYGNDPGQFPANNLFAAAGEGIWSNGAACGRQYLVRCLSSATPGTCVVGETISIKIVDRAAKLASRRGTALVLSTAAFRSIANPSADAINVEFRQDLRDGRGLPNHLSHVNGEREREKSEWLRWFGRPQFGDLFWNHSITLLILGGDSWSASVFGGFDQARTRDSRNRNSFASRTFRGDEYNLTIGMMFS